MNNTTYPVPELEAEPLSPPECPAPDETPPPACDSPAPEVGPSEPSPTPPPEAPPPPPRRSAPAAAEANARSERGAVIFLLALVLLLSLVAVGLGLQWDQLAESIPAQVEGLPDLPQFSQPAETEALEATPTDDGTVLPLADRPEGAAMSLQDIYKVVNPSVVFIQARLQRSYSQGTGVIMSADGYIITNQHVISGASEVQVSLSDGQHFPAVLIGSDVDTDLAVLKIDATDLPAAVFGRSNQMEVGDSVVAIGNPLGSQLTGGSSMSDGILSAVRRSVEIEGVEMPLLQTTAALNAGNSGGALVNDQGQVIGITYMKMVDPGYSAPVEGLGFAIPSTVTKTVVDDLIAYGQFAGWPMLGITVRPANEEELAAAGVDHGLYVDQVSPGTDAEAKGLQEGDLILSANGLELRQNDHLLSIKESLGVGDTLNLLVLRDGTQLELAVALMEPAAPKAPEE